MADAGLAGGEIVSFIQVRFASQPTVQRRRRIAIPLRENNRRNAEEGSVPRFWLVGVLVIHFPPRGKRGPRCELLRKEVG